MLESRESLSKNNYYVVSESSITSCISILHSIDIKYKTPPFYGFVRISKISTIFAITNLSETSPKTTNLIYISNSVGAIRSMKTQHKANTVHAG